MAGRKGENGQGQSDSTETGEADEESSSSNQLRLVVEDDDEENDITNLGDILEDEEEEEEELPELLDKFRNEWKQELEKQANFHCATAGPYGFCAATPNENSLKNSREVTPVKQIHCVQESCFRNSTANVAATDETDNFEKAKSLFLKGVDHEQKGQMHDAIRCYTQSVHLVSDIEKRLFSAGIRGGKRGGDASSQSSSISTSRSSTPVAAAEFSSDDDLISYFRGRNFESGVQKCCHRSKLARPDELHFTDLPMEVVLLIFRWVVGSELDLRMLEKLAQVCSGFYVLAREAEFWRMSCLRTWGVKMGILDEIYPSWREMYIHRPHVWHNGVYISKVTYIRHGEASFQDSFYRPWHIVVYYRYIRFFASGSVLMLTTPDEPKMVLQYLRSENPRYQAIMKGTYRLAGKDALTAYLVRTKKNCTETYLVYPYQRRKAHTSPYEPVEHAFVLQLKIGSTRKKKHIQLSWLNYESTVTYRNGQEAKSKFDLNEQNFPPLYYSRVRSYSAESESPL